ncbi:chlorophyllase/cutinase-like alpha/beta fold protein [Paenibacillus crassostreae]|uniref:Alpha/beta hydrolase n=1 Tax=Paenibacillus crassostreae TaxID=1763538 RepID=A0A167GLM8_9BACL|nr:hypothetical protein [Paenibacillus crassostreae]AOZ92230.1 hypothetical protein LPB68_08320 [Paenibacillus crassostreae]OAB77692.1 hypothetical protein PNBC_01400 [Paenibacillus crassostreae]
MELETNLYTPLKPSNRSRIKLKMKSRIKTTYALDTTFWRIAQSGVWAVGCFMFALTALSMPTSLGSMLDILLIITLGTLGLSCSAHLIALLLAVIGIRIPRLFAGGVLFHLIAFYFIFWVPGSGIVVSIVMALFLTLLGIIIGCWIALLVSQQVRSRTKWIVTILLSIILCTSIISNSIERSDIISESPITDPTVTTLQVSNPSELGTYDTQYFTYGSGIDLHREEYGPKSDLTSSSVDASFYIDEWPLLRTLFWGFNQEALPLNGRVWMPTGEGPFPLVLIVHGNHLMEDYSDDGYGYLGELLASRGFVAISVDENFLNYSVWSGIPDNDIKIRSWLLLKHIQQMQLFSEDPESPFYQSVDFNNIALIGHSRGGQAVAMAADAKQWFQSDSGLKEDLQNKTFTIQAVIALAPTDSKVDGLQAKLQNVSYMALQGARDGDLNEYFGERQYTRTSFSSDDVGFKTYLHIPNANHSQFNTTWGGLDTNLPKGLFLNRKQMMTGSDQRQIAKVYVSAFLETVLHDTQEYEPLFRDYRTGLNWLPNSIYFNRFEDAKFTALARYDEDEDRTTLSYDGKAEASDGIRWTEESISLQNKGVLLETTEDHSKETSYSLSWDEEDVTDTFAEADGLSLSIADQSTLKEEILTSGDILPIADVDIALETSDGVSVTLPLSQFMNLQPIITPQFTKSEWLEKHFDKGKYNLPEKAILQTVELPFEEIQKVNPKFNPALIHRITLNFSRVPSTIILDDVGLYR